MYRILTGVLITVFVGVLCAHATPGFQNVFDMPATKSRLADKSLLNGIALAGKRLVTVGQLGHILYSDDKGKSWTQVDVPTSTDLVSVFFPSAKKGWAVGHGGTVLHSADGGVTWVKQFDGRTAAKEMQSYYAAHPPAGEEGKLIVGEIDRFVKEGPDKPFLDVWFDDEKNGFIVGAFNLVFQTTNGGKNWVPLFDRTDNPMYLHFYAIKRLGQDLYIVGEQGLVLRLDRASGKFKKIDTPYQGTYFGITGKGASIVIYGMRGNAYRSTDRGANWKKIETGVPLGLTGATITEDGQIIIVSQSGAVLVSKDGGANFSTVKMDVPFPAAAVTAIDGNSVVLAGPIGVKLQTIK